MNRIKKHKVKKEKPQASTSNFREQEEHDLAYYIHDRVELMHQVFSVLKYKELKAMAPECVRHISNADLQELCTEELLGISSKRLCAILDGAEPPSDTESSSRSLSPPLETISLDSISSDEEILSQASSKKKKHKHRHRDSNHSKSKSKKKKSKDSVTEEVEKSKASRAGLTVLELLELQARARAIRAQLQQEQAAKLPSETAPPDSRHHSSDNEVEIKEEPAEVVEISSEDEKPKLEELQIEKPQSPVKQASPKKQPSPGKQPTTHPPQPEETTTVTKRINDLIITVPQSKPTRKIKLNRNKVTVSVPNVKEISNDAVSVENSRSVTVVTSEIPTVREKNLSSVVEKVKKKSKKIRKEKKKETIDEDHDEITLQLSDSEKMDLLQDLDRKAFENVSSSEDSESSSESESQSEKDSSKNTSLDGQGEAICSVVKKINETDVVDSDTLGKNTEKNMNVEYRNVIVENEKTYDVNKVGDIDKNYKIITETDKRIEDLSKVNIIQTNSVDINTEVESKESDITIRATTEKSNEGCISLETERQTDVEVEESSDKNSANMESPEISKSTLEKGSSSEVTEMIIVNEVITNKRNTSEHLIEISTINDIPLVDDANCKTRENSTNNDNILLVPNDSTHCEIEKDKQIITVFKKTTANELSEGEVSDRDSSEIEACELKPEVVCISDEETSRKKKKKKKDKKTKKEKRSKKSKPDFRDSADQNFYIDSANINIKESIEVDALDIENEKQVSKVEFKVIEEKKVIVDDDDIYEILELSDDSSCYEVEGTVLSKEPTAEEIEALSAKIDEIEREEVVTDEQIREHERLLKEGENNDEHFVNISWKERYLGSKKVKRVLTTSNILNALRKKNKELKKKLEESKKKGDVPIEIPVEIPVEKNLDEGSIEHYNALQGSTKYVDPIKEPEHKQEMDNVELVEKSGESLETTEDEKVTREMKKDAKQLLKMYKKLLKYNDMHKPRDPNKKKKKKQKKAKNKDGVSVATISPQM